MIYQEMELIFNLIYWGRINHFLPILVCLESQVKKITMTDFFEKTTQYNSNHTS